MHNRRAQITLPCNTKTNKVAGDSIRQEQNTIMYMRHSLWGEMSDAVKTLYQPRIKALLCVV